jgi:putative phosphoribosyl transferase
MFKFEDRIEAGQELAKSLHIYTNRKNTMILALPRGGVPVAYEVAKALSLPLDVLIVRKLGAPGQEELAMGAISLNDVCYLNNELIDSLQVAPDELQRVIAKEKVELERRNQTYRLGKAAPDVTGKTVIIIDDGLATGATMRAAISALREAKVDRIIVAVPVGPFDTCTKLRCYADEVTCLFTPEYFFGVGQLYQNFQQTSDEEVQAILKQYNK